MINLIPKRIEQVEIDNILLPDNIPKLLRIDLVKSRMPIIKDDGHIIYGENKIAAYKSLGYKKIECAIYPSDLEPEQYDLIRSIEKFKEDQTSWQARVKLEFEIHRLFQSLYGAGKRGRGHTGWGIKDTAAQLNISVGKLNEDVNLAKAFLIDPELEKSASRDIAKRVYEKAFKQVISEYSADNSVPKIEPDRAFYGKPELILRELPEDCFHAAIFEIDLHSDEWLADLFAQVYDKLGKDSFFYIFCDIDNFSSYKNLLLARNFKVQEYPLISLLNIDKFISPKPWQYTLTYESIIVAVNGDPALLDGKIHFSAFSVSSRQNTAKILLNHST